MGQKYHWVKKNFGQKFHRLKKNWVEITLSVQLELSWVELSWAVTKPEV